LAFGFRRLAILDLSERGHQPMHSSSGRFTIVFNGEVYNFVSLRYELERAGHRFYGHSDTEVILAAFEQWGVEPAVKRFVGMFAIAVWDKQTRSLSLIRDRLGIKPLYVSAQPGYLIFASELRGLIAAPTFERNIDRVALTEYLRNLYVPAPRTIYSGASKLLPGHILTVTNLSKAPPPSISYWSAESTARHGVSGQFQGSTSEAAIRLEQLLEDAVKSRMQADVPLGALLSGGIDSSTVVALMQATASKPIKTFSIAFEEKDFNEAHHARTVARYVGTDHSELLLTGSDALSAVPQLPEIFDEPFADASQVPAFLICRLARKDVTVAVSGDGGDEVFAGYNRYLYGARMIKAALTMPRPLRGLIARGAYGLGSFPRMRAWNMLRSASPAKTFPLLHAQHAIKIGQFLRHDSQALMYQSLVSAWDEPESVVLNGREGESELRRILETSDFTNLLDRMMLSDQKTYLVDDQLAKVDRVSMAVSLEVRLPLLDHRVVEFAWSLPTSLKIRGKESKWLLRQVLFRHVPRAVFQRPKMGWTIPILQWLRGPLRPWAEDLLDPSHLEDGGLIRARPVRLAWERLLGGNESEGLRIWAVLMYQAWKRRWA
jgi:asparagine synthase (glutamine-hydrolysing)